MLLFATGTGGFLAALDVSLANGLLPSIGTSFAIAGSAELSWIISVYAIVFAGALVPAGRLCDRFGRRAGFGFGLATLTVGSLVCAGAMNLPIMFIGRALQALGASAASPASIAMLAAAVHPDMRRVYAARWAGAGALGIASGPIVGAVTTELLSWRLAFATSALVGCLALLALARLDVVVDARVDRRMPDGLSAVLLIGATGAVTAGVSGISLWGGGSVGTISILLGAGVLSVLFVARCRAVDDPVLDLRLLRTRAVAASTAVTLLYSVAFFGLVYTFMLYLPNHWHLTLLAAGLAMLPIPVSVMILTRRIGGVADRRGFRLPVVTGVLMMGLGLLVTTAVGRGSSWDPFWLAALAVVGVGSGLSFPLLAAAAISGLPPTHLAAASAINQCARQIGAALGIAVSTVFIGQQDPSANQFHFSWFADTGFCVLAAICSAALPGRPASRGRKPSISALARRGRHQPLG